MFSTIQSITVHEFIEKNYLTEVYLDIDPIINLYIINLYTFYQQYFFFCREFSTLSIISLTILKFDGTISKINYTFDILNLSMSLYNSILMSNDC